MSFVDYLRLAQAITSIVGIILILYGFGFFDWFIGLFRARPR
jgi:hypothetical protein